MFLLLALIVLVCAIIATGRRYDVRLVLTLAALVLGILAGFQAVLTTGDEQSRVEAFIAGPMAIVRTFLATLVAEKFVVPICSAMGFAHILRLTQCDRHLIHLLTRPLERVRFLLIPGAVVVGYLVNIPVVSQTSTAVCLGAVLIPLLQAGGVSPITAGAALLLGSSIGGELLNPGAPEINTISTYAFQSETEIVARMAPLNLLHLALTTTFFWIGSVRFETRYHAEHKDEPITIEGPSDFRINYVKALIPVVPVIILFLAGPPLELLKIPREWLVNPNTGDAAFFSSRLVGAAMLAGTALAVLSTPSAAREAARTFFEGAGYAFTNIIAVIVAATCFGEGIRQIGLAVVVAHGISEVRSLFLPGTGALALGFAFLCGSGMASTQSLFRFFVEPAGELGIGLADVGAMVSLGAAAGRTMSPVSTVGLMCASMTGTDILALVRRVVVPLLVSMAIVMTVAALTQ
jgi:DcuC family C4-dicarboxylate transporter